MSADSKPPTKFGVVLFPGFQSLDVFGPCDLLATHSRFNTLSIAMLSSTLEPVPSNLLPTGGCGQLVVPTHTFDNAPEDIEVLLVPGGPGTRDDDIIAPAMAYVKKVYPKLRYLLTVCTGSALVAKTGLLDGKRATTNKKSFKWATCQGLEVNWVLEARWVTDGNIWTSSGISAGIDMMLAFMAAVYGEDAAQSVADHSEYRRHTDANDDPFAKLAGV
ncbi:class I glutamine amidotransferase-like protein [Apiospora arundinis]